MTPRLSLSSTLIAITSPALFGLLLAGCNCNDPVTPTDAGGGDASDAKVDAASNALQHGILGRHAALVAHKGQLLASAYETKYGDLVLVTVKVSELTKLTKVIVDGVPANATPTKTGWRDGVEIKGDDVGLDTDIAIAQGEPIISYRDETNNALKLATRTVDKWRSHAIEAAKSGTDEVVGRYTSLALVGGKPAVAYLAYNLADASGGTFRSELRWAEATKAAPTSSSDWKITVIDKAPMPCRNLCGSSEVCAVKSDGTSACAKKGTGCGTCASGEECVGGACTTILEDDKITDIPWARGLWADAVVVGGDPVVIYYDRVKGNLMGAARKSGQWKTAVIKGTATDDVGAYCTAAVDAANTLHVAYQDAAKAALNYVQVDSATLAAKVSEVIDDGLRSDGSHPVGADPALLIDGSGKPRVLYQDQQNADLLGATRGGPNSWTPKKSSDADLGRLLKGGKQGYGFYSGLALEGGKLYGLTFYYDAEAKPKGGLVFFSVN